MDTNTNMLIGLHEKQFPVTLLQTPGHKIFLFTRISLKILHICKQMTDLLMAAIYTQSMPCATRRDITFYSFF